MSERIREWSRAHPQMLARVRERSRALQTLSFLENVGVCSLMFANIRVMLMFANVRARSRTFVRIRERLCALANVCERSRTFVGVCERSCAFANVCARSRTFVRVRERSRAFANVCTRS